MYFQWKLIMNERQAVYCKANMKLSQKAIGFKGEKLDRLIIQSKSFKDSWRKESVTLVMGQ